MLPVGYYYEEFDAEYGARVLVDVIKNHDYQHHQYIAQAKSFLNTLSITHEHNVMAHQYAVIRLMER